MTCRMITGPTSISIDDEATVLTRQPFPSCYFATMIVLFMESGLEEFMNFSDKVNTVLDLSGYDAFPGSSLPLWLLVGVPLGLVVIGMLGMLEGFVFLSRNRPGSRSYRILKRIMIGGIGAMFLGVILSLVSTVAHDNTPSFSDYVNKAYGFESSNLPDGKPEDGCLSVTWEKDGEIHSGTLNLLDNKISIKEIGGDYLEVAEQASQKNGE